ncbi:Spt20 family-domain-containing protein [Roridomyces roridus]|uniref:Spt20 family-domain-containing protein n=1 Tax=Roridomyces roridus TaxID=1738132 RepID=A0AAD7B2T5_9AGAR|nr:Spt20 family-domain-containing protein [Roridomyces roridus]
MAGYNRTRYVEELLDKNEANAPSFSVHLHPEHWTLNNVSKFLYNTQISGLLDDIRAHRIPVDFLDLFDAVKVPFYDGCMIVELLDYRPQHRSKDATTSAAPLDKPERTRVVLHPNGETIFADICSLNRKSGSKWTDRDALEVESRILLATAPPLCLAPDPHLTRVVNHVLRVSTPTAPISLKRKAAAMDPEEDQLDKARRNKIMQFMNPRPGRTHTQSYKVLDAIHRSRMAREGKPPTPAVPSAEPMQQQPPPPQHSAFPAPVDKLKKQTQNRPGTPKTGFANGSAHGSASQTPSPTHHFSMPSSMEAAKRAPTPLQNSYAPSPPSVPQQTQPQPPPGQPVQPHQPRPPSAVPTFQPQIPNAQFLNQPPLARNPNLNGQAKPPVMNKPGGAPNGQIPTAQQLYYAQHMQQRLQQQAMQQAAQQHAQQNGGRATPRPGMPVNGAAAAAAQANAAALAAARGSPLAPSANQRLATRSPAGNPNTGQPSAPSAPPQLNFAYGQTHLRPPAANGNAGSPRPPAQGIPPHLAAAAAAARGSPSPVPPNANGRCIILRLCKRPIMVERAYRVDILVGQ